MIHFQMEHRGKYHPPNAPPDGERPLYLHISAASHVSILIFCKIWKLVQIVDKRLNFDVGSVLLLRSTFIGQFWLQSFVLEYVIIASTLISETTLWGMN